MYVTRGSEPTSTVRYVTHNSESASTVRLRSQTSLFEINYNFKMFFPKCLKICDSIINHVTCVSSFLVCIIVAKCRIRDLPLGADSQE